MQFSVKQSGRVREKLKKLGFLADEDDCDAQQRRETAQEKVSNARRCVYTRFPCLEGKQREKGSTMGWDCCKGRRS